MTSSPRYLVTGAAGFIGSHVSEALIARGAAVTGVDNFDAFYAREVKERNLAGLLISPSFRFVEADVARDPLPLDDVEAIIHLAAKPGVRPSLEDPASYMEANVTATARIFDGARRVGVTRIVFGSSSSVYGNATPAPFAEAEPAVEPISPYAASKRSGELLAHAFAHLYPLRIICLERDYTYITDALDGILAGLEWTGRAADGSVETVNLGGGARVRLDRLIALIAAALGQEARIERHPDQPGDVRLTDADLAHAGRVLGFRPRVGIEEGIRKFVDWYQEVHGRQSRAPSRAS